MPSYLDTQVEEAFRKAKGNLTKARTILIQMASEDQRLLMALSKPYLTAIAAQSLNRFTSQSKKKSPAAAIPPLPKNAKNQEGFGLDLLKALGGHNVPKFGQEAAAPPVRKKAASSDHVNALKLMAAKSKSRIK
jgi:hypothetical protein